MPPYGPARFCRFRSDPEQEAFMSATTQDRPTLDPKKFSASLIETPGLPHNLSVSGQGVGDYRV